MPEADRQAGLEELFRRYWFPLRERCRRLLGDAEAAERVARDCLAALVAERGPRAAAAEPMERLWRAATAACLERLAGRRGREAAWLQSLARAGGAEPATGSTDPAAGRVRDLLPRIKPRNRPLVAYRYLDGLEPATIARLTGLAEGRVSRRLERFGRLANELLAERGEAPLEPPGAGECPDELALDRLLAGESRGLEPARARLAEQPDCARRQAERAERMAETTSPEAVAAGVEALELALQRPGRRPGSGRRGRRSVWLAALGLAVLMGLAVWLALPGPETPEENPLLAQGGYSLQVLYRDGERLRPARSGQRLPAGTRVRFALGAARPMLVTLAALGEQGPTELISPRDNPVWPVPVGRPVQAPFLYRLPAGTGPERIFALFCPVPGPMNYFADMLEYAYPLGASGRRDLRRDFVGAPKHCQLRSVLIERTTEPLDFHGPAD